MRYIIHTDGGSRGNPGQAACGVVISQSEGGTGKDTIHTVAHFGKPLGVTTNNVAEYSAVVSAFEYLLEHTPVSGDRTPNEYHFFLDSTLVVNQLNGMFRMKDAKLREYLSNIRILEQKLGGTITYTYVPREQNADADREVNAVLDIACM